MIEKLNAALHDELGDVQKYMLMSGQIADKYEPIIRQIACDELRHARLLIDMIHDLGGEVTDEEHAQVKKAQAAVAEKK